MLALASQALTKPRHLQPCRRSKPRLFAVLQNLLQKHGCWIIKGINVGVPPAEGDAVKYLRHLMEANVAYIVRFVRAICASAGAVQALEDAAVRKKNKKSAEPAAPLDVFAKYFHSGLRLPFQVRCD